MENVSQMLFPFYFSILVLIIVSQANAAEPRYFPFCANDIENYTLNSTYQNNLKTLLSNLTSNTEITYGFYNFSYGQDTNKVYAVGLCRGDVNPHDCRSCLNDISPYFTKDCPNKKEAMIWSDNCMLRYSNRSILGVMESDPWHVVCNPFQASNVDKFHQVLEKLLGSLRNTVLSGDSRRKYGATHVSVIGPISQSIYGLMQCTPDISSRRCDECLSWALIDLQQCTKDNNVGGTMIRPNCNIRYETYLFFESTLETQPPPLPSSPPQSPPPSTNRTFSKGIDWIMTFLL